MTSRASGRMASAVFLLLLVAAIGIAGIGFAPAPAASCARLPARAATAAEDGLLVEGEELWRLQHYAPARALFERMLAQWPDSPHAAHAHYYAGRAAAALEDRSAARAHLDSAVTHRGFVHVAQAQLVLGRLAFAEEKFLLAADHFEQATALAASCAERAESSFELGQALLKAGRFRPARDALAACRGSAEWENRATYLLHLPRYFTVEAGAFLDEASARARLDELEDCGLEGEILSPATSGIPLHSVCSGRFFSRNAALSHRDRVWRHLGGAMPQVLP